MSKFEVTDIEFLCGGEASAILLPTTGSAFLLADCTINRPKDRAVTSSGQGCQSLQLDNCQFLSNEQGTRAQDRTTVVFNANANDIKVRNNRAVRFAHFGVVSGSGSMFVGNHFFGGDEETLGVRRAGLVLTLPNSKTYITGNYIDNCFIELSNEHDDRPDFSSEFSFGGLTMTGNVFTAQDTGPWFRWIVITPRGPGHFVSGLSVTGNVFRTRNGDIDRVEMIDTSFATLAFNSFRNVTFEANTFNGVVQPTTSPVMVQHTQNTAADTWVVDAAAYLPFGGRARNVMGLVAEGPVSNATNVNQYVMPYVLVEQGANQAFVHVKWPTPVKGRVQATIRCDNPI